MTNSNRLLMKFEQLTRQINRDIINPEIEVLTIEELRPVAELVAHTRAAYLKHLFKVSKHHSETGELPNSDELDELHKLRQSYIELADASKSLEIAIQRDYLDMSDD